MEHNQDPGKSAATGTSPLVALSLLWTIARDVYLIRLANTVSLHARGERFGSILVVTADDGMTYFAQDIALPGDYVT